MFAYGRVEPLRKRSDKSLRLCRTGRETHVLVSRALTSETDIVGGGP